jgi:N-acetylneuraminic acid mutarotase
MSIERSSLSTVSLGSNIFIMGGYDKEFNILDTIEVFNTNLNKSQKINSLPEPLSNFCSFIYKDEIYILGGRTKNGLSDLIRKSKIKKEN